MSDLAERLTAIAAVMDRDEAYLVATDDPARLREAAAALAAPDREALARAILDAIWRHDADIRRDAPPDDEGRYSWRAFCECGWSYGPCKVGEARCNHWLHVSQVAADAVLAALRGEATGG